MSWGFRVDIGIIYWKAVVALFLSVMLVVQINSLDLHPWIESFIGIYILVGALVYALTIVTQEMSLSDRGQNDGEKK